MNVCFALNSPAERNKKDALADADGVLEVDPRSEGASVRGVRPELCPKRRTSFT